jgi:hypothetical protein
VAVGPKLLFITMLQGLPPLQIPLHPENAQPLAGVAFMVTEVPPVYAALQAPVPPTQLILPSVLVTVPSPTEFTVSV